MRPITALSPKDATSTPSISQASVPLSRWMTRGARSLYFAGRWSWKNPSIDGPSTTWSSTLTRIMSPVSMGLLHASPIGKTKLVLSADAVERPGALARDLALGVGGKRGDGLGQLLGHARELGVGVRVVRRPDDPVGPDEG